VLIRLAVVSLIALTLGWSEEPEAILKRAVQAQTSGDIDAAIGTYREYLKMRPHDSQADRISEWRSPEQATTKRPSRNIGRRCSSDQSISASR